jgi:hypothetical protein
MSFKALASGSDAIKLFCSSLTNEIYSLNVIPCTRLNHKCETKLGRLARDKRASLITLSVTSFITLPHGSNAMELFSSSQIKEKHSLNVNPCTFLLAHIRLG